MASQKVQDIFTKLENRLQDVKHLVKNFANISGSKRATIRQITVDGRSLTNILQLLRNKVEGFDAWYEPKVQEMRNDEMMRYFYLLRSDTLKEGEDRLGGANITAWPDTQFSFAMEGIGVKKRLLNGEIKEVFIPAPENTINKMINSDGTFCYLTKDANGKEEKHYIDVPVDTLKVSIKMNNSPKFHLGKSIEGLDSQQLCQLYFDYLQQLCEEAKEKFLLADS